MPKGSRWGGRRRWGLRRRLTFAFAFVALMAVGLTNVMTLGAVFDAQRELFTVQAPGDVGWGWESPEFAAARTALQGVVRTGFLAGLVSFVLASLTAALFTRVLTRPLLALTEGARRLGAGERGLELPLPRAHDELRTLTEAFNGLVTDLERQERWRRELVADIAHDLRTPLAVMRSDLEAMQDGLRPLDETGAARLHAEVMLLSKLVTDLSTLSRAEAGALPLRLEPTPLAPLLTGLAASFEARALEVGVELTVHPVPTSLCADLDRGAMLRVLANLLDNALRYAAPGRVALGAERADAPPIDPSDAWVRLWVRDEGPGLPEGAEGRLFERFYRGDAARTRREGGGEGAGSGLGLSIAKALTEAHGGSLTAANHPEGGAVFSLLLPVKGAQAPPSA